METIETKVKKRAEMVDQLKDEFDFHHVELLESKLEYAGAIFQVRNDLVRFNAGEQVWRQYLVHDSAVAIVPLRLREGELEVMLIRQYRHPAQQIFWEIPAGLRDLDGELAVESARRELLEETGMVADVWEPLVKYCASPGCSDENVELFVALNPDLTEAKIDFTREAEEAELIQEWFTLDEVTDAIFRGDLRSPALVLGVLAIQVKRNEWIAKLGSETC